MYTVSAQGHFDAAHFLKGYPGKCSNLHGHRWTIVAKVVAEELTEDGMVVDFKDQKHDLRDLCEAY
ncbi:MAG: 6-carboxytetrahydropterin synthase, partial [Clostridia bacterium]|nr:6-carboxytetrahydropterin synthase [Clostridia bacterium]